MAVFVLNRDLQLPGKIQRPTKGKNRDLSVEKLYAGTITSRNTKNGTTKKSIVFRDIEIEPSKD